MREYYTIEDWQQVITENKVIDLLNNKLTYKEVASILKEREYRCTADSIRMAIGRLGFVYDETRGIWKNKIDKEFDSLTEFIDIEETIDTIAERRYYQSFKDGFYNEDRKTIKIDIDKNIYDEYIQLAKEAECELEDEYLNLVLLEALETLKPIDRRREFILRELKDHYEYSDEEINFVLEVERLGYKLANQDVVDYIESGEPLHIKNYISFINEIEKQMEDWNKRRLKK